ncbi:hypothetical protein KUTeg_015555 [Tegillarca granosa]|uniref:Nas2 N-terminal domain-containing protein n=1 Tax=Tegillarca granosa TaxID=220873 RepID=A0ABQ9ESX2_TEGGR|nr:hypothetical protein KUTeg_015555 [Tegillarca granosa]
MAATTEHMNQLIKKKDEIEAQIKELNGVLDSQQGVGMKEALVDTEGYPRADIDIYSVRHARHQIICLQNDHKDVMKEIEEELYRIHEKARLNKEQAMETSSSSEPGNTFQERLSPFAVVDRVEEGSPASQSVYFFR